MQRRPDSEFEIRIEYAAILSALHETANGTQNDAERFLRQAATKRGIAFETFVSGLLENIHRPFLKPCRERPLKPYLVIRSKNPVKGRGSSVLTVFDVDSSADLVPEFRNGRRVISPLFIRRHRATFSI